MSSTPSFACAFGDTLSSLGVPVEAMRPMQAAFADIAMEWAEACVDGPAPFSSGICPDASPVEISLRERRDGRIDARFIAQPCEPSVPPDRRAAWSAGRARAFVRRWGGAAVDARLARALTVFPTEADPTFTGNFWLWLGLAADARGEHAAKVYFNPWACLPDFRGAYALHHLLTEAGFETTALSHVLPWMRPEVGGTPQIVGWNLQNDTITSVKLYLATRLDRRRLAELVPAAWAPWARCTVPMRPEGEVDVALLCRGAAAPETRLNLFCPDWFRSDADVIAALRPVAPALSRALDAALARTRHPGRIVNFVALDPDSATAYVKVG